MTTDDGVTLPLSGIRILDLGRVVSGPFATQVLADLGAQVIRVESVDLADGEVHEEAAGAEGELVEAEAFTWGLNRNKYSICVDLKAPAGRDLVLRLAAESDVVFDNFRPGVMERLGLGHDSLVAAVGERIITCSLTGFGESGPWARMPAYDPVVQALSGGMHLTRAHEAGGRPVRWGVPIGDILAGLYSCIGILAALNERDRSGWGQHVEVAMLDVMLALNTVRVPMALTFGWKPVPMPFEGGQGTVPYGTFECRDGWLALGVMDRSWADACRIIERADLVDDPRFADLRSRQMNRRELVSIFQEQLRRFEVEPIQAKFLEAGVVAGRVTGVGEVFDHPQVLARNMVVEIADDRGRSAKVAGDPLKMSDSGSWRAPGRPGRDTESLLSGLLSLSVDEIDDLFASGVVAGSRNGGEGRSVPPVQRRVPPLREQRRGNAPLEGTMLVELDGEEPSKAFAAQILADLGARVVRVDRPPAKGHDPYPDDARASAYRCGLNRNKESVVADLKSPDGAALVRALVSRADAVLDNYRPGVSSRLGVDPESLLLLNETVVTCSITGFGHTGPWRSFPAYDAAIQALGGGQSITADPAEPGVPVRWGNPIGGLTGSLYAAIGILAGLRERRQGRGRRIDLALLDAQVALLSYRVPQVLTTGKRFVPEPRRGGSGSLPFGVFDAAEESWVVLSITQQFWSKFCDVVERPELVDDPRFVDEPSRRQHQAELDILVEELMLTQSASTWQERCFAAGIPGVEVVSLDQAFATEQAQVRGMRVVLPDTLHPEGVVVAGHPVKYSRYEPDYRRAPITGADTEAVQAEFLGEPAHEAKVQMSASRVI